MPDLHRFSQRLCSSIEIISYGVLLILIGLLFILYPLIEEIQIFIANLKLVQVTDTLQISLPSSPPPLFYQILGNFALIWGSWLIIVLCLRLATKDKPSRSADTLSDSVFWLGTAYLFYQVQSEALRFEHLIAGLIVLLGINIVIRAATKIAIKQ